MAFKIAVKFRLGRGKAGCRGDGGGGRGLTFFPGVYFSTIVNKRFLFKSNVNHYLTITWPRRNICVAFNFKCGRGAKWGNSYYRIDVQRKP